MYFILLYCRVKWSVHESGGKDVKAVSDKQCRDCRIECGHNRSARVERNGGKQCIPIIGDGIANQGGKGDNAVYIERCDQNLWTTQPGIKPTNTPISGSNGPTDPKAVCRSRPMNESA